jgi:Pyruvate/2-oxoacid:ferredoxin oxidoreductase delta subunit
MLRNIIEIDTEKCTGCGLCLTNCAESALAIVDGKAKLVKDIYCDGLGACLGACPEGALTIVQREAEPFDEAAAMAQGAHCPGTLVHSTAPQPTLRPLHSLSPQGSALTNALPQWPVQLRLVPADAPFLRHSHIVLAADCAGFAYPALQELLEGKRLLIACPKLDDTSSYEEKLSAILRTAQPTALTVLRMSVPCCGGLERMARAAQHNSGCAVPLTVLTVNN